MKYTLYIIFLLSWSLAPTSSSAQHTSNKAEVRDMFPAGTRDLWINFLSGTVDGTHVMDMVLGTDGHTCKGMYTLRNSKETFYFEGEEINKKLNLVELNAQTRATGFLVGNYNGDTFEGEWKNIKKNIKLPFKLSFVTSFDDFRLTKCQGNKWIRLYKGEVDNKVIYLSVSKEADDYICSVNQDGKLYNLKFKGKTERYNKFDFDLSRTVLHKKWAILDSMDYSKIALTSLDNTGKETLQQLKNEASLDFECYEYADYFSRLECIRPVSTNDKFNLWIENTFKTWLNNSTKKIQNTKTDDIGSYDRWVQIADGWVEVDLFMDNMISGSVYMQSSWSNITEKKSFIYDLDKGKEVVLQDIFDDNFDSKGYFKQVIPAKKKVVRWKPEMVKWIDKQKFSHITLKDNGIRFSTDFNTVYGEEEILVAYKEVEANLKSKSLIKTLIGK